MYVSPKITDLGSLKNLTQDGVITKRGVKADLLSGINLGPGIGVVPNGSFISLGR